MSYFTINLDSIEKNRKNLFQKIAYFDKAKVLDGVTLVDSLDTREDNKALVVHLGNEEYRLNSLYRPSAEAKKWAEQFEFHNVGTIVSMFGMGNGIFPREILNKLDYDEMLLIYEPSPSIFLHVLEHYDITDLIEDKRVCIVVEEINETEFKYTLREVVNWMTMNSQEVIKHPQYVKMFDESHAKFRNTIIDVNEMSMINRNTEKVFSKKIIDNTLHNLSYVKTGNILDDFIGSFPQEVPAIIVSAGPSLDKNIDKLHAAVGKSIIMATDTSLKFLFKHDITPDFIVTLDPNKSMRHFEDDRCKEIPLFCLFEANQKILDLHKDRKIFYNPPEFLFHIYEKFGKGITNLNSGGSVATGAFSICAGLGFKKIILIGQDLAYSGNKTHAGGKEDTVNRIESDARYVEDVFGNQVKTRPDWYMYLSWFNQAVEWVKSKDVEVIDATEGGAKITGTTIMSLDEAIQQYCIEAINAKEILHLKQPTFNENEWNDFVDYIDKARVNLVEIKRKSKEASNLCEKLIIEAKKGTIDSPKSQNWVKKVSKHNKSMEEIAVYTLVEVAMIDNSINALDNVTVLSDDELENQINTYKKAISFYRGIIKASEDLEVQFEECVNSLKTL